MCLQPLSLLLGLPTELRLQIYDEVVLLPLDCQVATGRPSSRQPVQAAPTLSISWFSLTLVCKTITEELRDYLLTSGNTTYELDIDNLDKRRIIADTVTWRQIPCPPSSVRTLQANLVLHFRTGFGGCGGPAPILSQLYQVLNRFIHNGPLLSRQSPLVSHIHLSTLIVQLCVKDPDPEERRAQGHQPYDKMMVDKVKKGHRRDIEGYIYMLVNRGLLFGAVDKIVCRWAHADDQTTEWEVSKREIGDMKEWNTYGFRWGVPGSSSLAEQPSQSDV
ncbi:hypothetical protein MSAN_01552900 [Mycena sanguinolenta]|uniref:Uncharacterized protein n=1 Tax=Mycena sanguinolenta TaxID=230812 RepID=A0A8H6Y0W5_9AGAR|nr:hypothetical protein MSAN_01552900 [Mycena sanguinolenta]